MARGLTKDSIVQAALDVLDESGVDGLTVRAVASRLGVQAPALYWHVRDKQELLDEMATEVWRRIVDELAELPDDTPWEDGFRAFATVTRRALLSHRDGAKVFAGTYLTDPSVIQRQEAGIARMVQQGFALAGVIRAWSLLYNFTIGFCIEEQAVAQTADDRYSLSRRSDRLDGDAHPLVADAGPELFGDPERRFAELVALIVQAAAGLRTGAETSAPA